MPKHPAQLEFRFPAWLRGLSGSPSNSPRDRPIAAPESLRSRNDRLVSEAAQAFGLPELARKVQGVLESTDAHNRWTRLVAGAHHRTESEAQGFFGSGNLAHPETRVRPPPWPTNEAAGRRIDPHGAEWRAACAELGIPGESPYHSLPLKGRRMKQKALLCLPFLPRRRSPACPPMRRAVACYACCKKHNGGRYHDRFA